MRRYFEANLIKHYWPKYNIRDKDNRSFLYLVFTKEDFPKPLLVRGTDLGDDSAKKYKPYLARIPHIDRSEPPSISCAKSFLVDLYPGQKRPCFYVHLKQCPGVCQSIEKKPTKNHPDMMKFFEGKKMIFLKQYTREMKTAAKEKRFEEATMLRNRVFFLEHIQDIAMMKREDEDVDKMKMGEATVSLYGRIEGYDISHISGTSTVASMVVFENGAPAKAEYRKFRIRSVSGPNDVASIRETLMRRFRHPEWPRPDLLLIDGGGVRYRWRRRSFIIRVSASPSSGSPKVQNENAMILFVLDKTLNYVAFVNSTEICL